MIGGLVSPSRTKRSGREIRSRTVAEVRHLGRPHGVTCLEGGIAGNPLSNKLLAVRSADRLPSVFV